MEMSPFSMSPFQFQAAKEAAMKADKSGHHLQVCSPRQPTSQPHRWARLACLLWAEVGQPAAGSRLKGQQFWLFCLWLPRAFLLLAASVELEAWDAPLWTGLHHFGVWFAWSLKAILHYGSCSCIPCWCHLMQSRLYRDTTSWIGADLEMQGEYRFLNPESLQQNCSPHTLRLHQSLKMVVSMPDVTETAS